MSEHNEHAHEGHSVWQEGLEVFLDPSHIISEVLSAIVWDVLVFLMLLPLIRLWIRRLRNRIHSEIDAEHGIQHDEGVFFAFEDADEE